MAIYDAGGNQLGYLKREVAVWFAPLLDRGRAFRFRLQAITSAGSLIVAALE